MKPDITITGVERSANSTLLERLRPFGPAILFWFVMVAVYSTSSAPAGVAITWPQGLLRSLLNWTIWALLLPVIVKVDQLLAVSKEDHFNRFAFHIPLSLFFTILMQLVMAAAISFFPHSSPELAIDAFGASFKGVLQANYLAYWVVISTYVASDYHKHLKEREIRTAELERQVAESRMETLRAQLNPNFLFNALNTISALVEPTPRAARRMLEELGGFLRLSLAHSEDQEVPLTQEIAFVEHYLNIQKAGFAERVAAMIKVDPDVLHALVPSFILQPLVEDAILHMMSPASEKSCVEVRAWKCDGHLHLRVRDDGSRLTQSGDPGQNLGLGISNTRERLRHLYGGSDQSFEISSMPGKGVSVDLCIPFRQG